jgi:hypothetical protein
MRRRLVFFLCFAVLVVSAIETSSGRINPQAKQGVARCLTADQLAEAVHLLSRDYNQAQVGQRLLRQSSRRSSTCRQQIIAAVMKAMDKPDLDISRDQASNYLWREGAILLGDLKATQSLDLLLSHISMTDGEWSSTMVHQPALEGIIRMGPVAIPKLKKLLRHQDWQTRQDAVFCIANIGGPSALRAIKAAISNESHSCVKGLMLASIKVIDVKHGGMKADNGEWAKAFTCYSPS